MDENAGVKDPTEQPAGTRRQWELSYGHRAQDWPDPLRERYEPAQDELGLLYSQVPGHRWNGWRRLTGDEDYYAACSCGWRSTETGYVSPMLVQVKEHLDAVQAVRGWGRPAPAARASAPAGGERGAGQRELQPDERARELYAAAEGQQRRLSQFLGNSTDLLSASQEQADRFVAALEYAAARIVPEWARSEAAARRAEALQRRVERAKQMRNGIVAAAAAIAAMAEEITLVNQDLKPRRPRGLAEHRRPAGAASRPAGEASPARAATADQACRDEDLLDQVVNRLFQAGLTVESAAGLPHDAAMQRIAGALDHLEDTIHEIRNHVFAIRHGSPASPPASQRPAEAPHRKPSGAAPPQRAVKGSG